MQSTMIDLKPGAIAKIRDLLAEENDPALKLRIFVQGGGCSGMSYGFTFDQEVQEDDFDLDFEGVHILVDSMSSQYLQGSSVDYIENLMGSEFKISNPNAQTSCGCGSSFSI
jgi:iron-sulfur cluster insertion protein